MPNDGKTTTDVYQRFPKNRKTLGVRWPKRHGVTAPLKKSTEGTKINRNRQTVPHVNNTLSKER